MYERSRTLENWLAIVTFLFVVGIFTLAIFLGQN